MANINDFKTHLSTGGARANQFVVTLNFPNVTDGIIAATQGQFLCSAASLPGSLVENIAVPYRGKMVNFAGERTFNPWQVTVINENNFNIRSAFESWFNAINNNAAIAGRINPSSYQVQMQVTQLDRNSSPLQTYEFHDAYPIDMGDIALSYADGGAIEEFTVNFQYNYWTNRNAGGTGAFGISGAVNAGPFGTVALPGITI